MAHHRRWKGLTICCALLSIQRSCVASRKLRADSFASSDSPFLAAVPLSTIDTLEESSEANAAGAPTGAAPDSQTSTDAMFLSSGELSPEQLHPPSPAVPNKLPQIGGLTIEQKGQIIMAAGSAAFAGDMTFSTVGEIYGAKGMTDMKHTGVAVGSALGCAGYWVAMVAVWIDSTDVVQQFMIDKFAEAHQKLERARAQLHELPKKVESSDALQTYIQERATVTSINTAVAEWQNALFDPAMLDLLVDQCTAYPPLAFLTAMHASLTADGSCGFPTQCWLAPDAGVAKEVSYSRPAFVEWVKLFMQDGIFAANYAVECAAARGALNETINSLKSEVQGLYTDIVNALFEVASLPQAEYHDNVMTTVFWQNQFETDVTDGISAGGNNQALADGLQGTLSSKYDFLSWGVAVWDGVTGSDKQGMMTSGFNADNPDAKGSQKGGSFSKLRFQANASKKSFMVWFTPTGQAQPDQATFDAAMSDCSAGCDKDMVELASCVSQKLLPANDVLCMRDGGNNIGANLAASIGHATGTLETSTYEGSYHDGYARCYAAAAAA